MPSETPNDATESVAPTRRPVGRPSGSPEAHWIEQRFPVLTLMQPLDRARPRAGTFRSDLRSQRHLLILLALILAISGELQARRLPAAEIECAVVVTVLGALGATAVVIVGTLVHARRVAI